MKNHFTLQIGRMDNGELEVSPIKEDIVSEILCANTFFRITNEEEIEAWNEYVEREWKQLDDADYYAYEIPFVHTTEWHTYYNGYIYLLKNYIKKITDDLNRAKDFSSKVAYIN